MVEPKFEIGDKLISFPGEIDPTLDILQTKKTSMINDRKIEA